MNVADYGALRVAELASPTWDQVIPRDTAGEVQLALVGKGDKPRHVLLPADVAKDLRTMRSGASGSARVFPITERRINYILKAVAKRAGVSPIVQGVMMLLLSVFRCRPRCPLRVTWHIAPDSA